MLIRQVHGLHESKRQLPDPPLKPVALSSQPRVSANLAAQLIQIRLHQAALPESNGVSLVQCVLPWPVAAAGSKLSGACAFDLIEASRLAYDLFNLFLYAASRLSKYESHSRSGGDASFGFKPIGCASLNQKSVAFTALNNFVETPLASDLPSCFSVDHHHMRPDSSFASQPVKIICPPRFCVRRTTQYASAGGSTARSGVQSAGC
jgi:hypothetical protein